MNINEKIRKIREMRDYSQEYVAGKMKMTQGGYSNLEKHTDISYSTLEKISNILEVNIIDLITYDEKNILSNHLASKDKEHHIITTENLKSQYEIRILEKERQIAFLQDILQRIVPK